MNAKKICFTSLVVVAGLWVMPAAARGQIFVSSEGEINEPGTAAISEYSMSGATLNANLIPNLTDPGFLAVSGGNLFVVINGGVSEYSTADLLSANVTPGLTSPDAIAVSGGDIFVTSPAGISEYTTGGTLVSANLAPGVIDPGAIAISGDDLFVIAGSGGGPVIGEYTTAGSTINASLISLSGGDGLAVSGNNLFVSDFATGNNDGTLTEYNLVGTPVPTTLFSNVNKMYDVATGPDGTVYYTHLDPDAHTSGEVGHYPGSPNFAPDDEHPFGIAIVIPTPEPATWTLLAMGASALLLFGRRFRRRAA